jgi:uncharacterized protein (TIGR02147 family)
MTVEKSDIRMFMDYRTLLADRIRAAKAADSKFSHRFICRRMGISSSGWLADVLAGRQKLKSRHVAPLSAVLRLDDREAEVLRALVLLESSESSEARATSFAKLQELRGIDTEQVDRDRFLYFERWYFPALRELLLLAPFDGDYAALGEQLDPPISAQQARKAVGVLRRLGLLTPGAPSPTLVKRPGKTTHWAKIMTAYGELARPAILKYGPEDRDFSSLILSLSPEGMKAASSEIAGLRRRLLAIAARDSGRRRVYQALIQVFPLSQSVEDSRA